MAIEADDAGRHAGEHRLHEAAPLGELGVGGDEVGALALQLLGHGVEIHRQAAQIALAAADRQLDFQVALGDVLGGADQPPDRRDEAAGKPDPDPDRRQQRGERDHEVHHAVRELEAAPDLAQAFIGAHAGFRAPQVLHHLRIDAAGDVEIGVRVVAKLGQRRHAEGVLRHQQRHLPALGGADQMLGRGDVGDLLVLEHGHLHRALGVDHVGDRQVAQAGLGEHQLAKLARVVGDGGRRIVEVLGHVDDVGADHLAVLVEIGVRDIERVLHDRHGLLVEPVVERAREGGGGGNRQQQGRQRRDQAEQADDARVQPGAGHLLLPRPPQPYRVHGDDRDHGDDQQQVDEQNDVDDLFARRDRRQVGQDQESRERPHHRQADDDEADPEGAAAGAWQRRRTGIEHGIERRLGLRHQSAHALACLPQCRDGAPVAARARKQLAPSPEHRVKRWMSAH